MTLQQGQYKELSVKHKQLEDAINNEMANPDWDEIRVHALKKEKLRVKDELERLKALN